MSLSDKIKETQCDCGKADCWMTWETINTEDVKEFIEKIIKKFKRMKIVSGDVIEFEIKQEAGEKLTKDSHKTDRSNQ